MAPRAAASLTAGRLLRCHPWCAAAMTLCRRFRALLPACSPGSVWAAAPTDTTTSTEKLP